MIPASLQRALQWVYCSGCGCRMPAAETLVRHGAPLTASTFCAGSTFLLPADLRAAEEEGCSPPEDAAWLSTSGFSETPSPRGALHSCHRALGASCCWLCIMPCAEGLHIASSGFAAYLPIAFLMHSCDVSSTG